MAEIATTVETTINRPPDEVFAWVTEAENQVHWMNGVKDVNWVRRQEVDMPRPQDTWATVYEYRGKPNNIVMEVDVCDPRTRTFEFHTIEGPFPIRVVYQCEPSGDGTLFRMNLTGLSDGAITAFMFKALPLLIKPMMRRQYEGELATLKSKIEDS